MRWVIISAWACVLLLSTALSNPSVAADEQRQARIPFANHGSIDSWQADGDDAIYIKGPGRQWYRGEFVGRCRDLDSTETIGFETSGIGDLDSFSTILVRGRPCPLKNLVKSDPPPKKTKKAKIR